MALELRDCTFHGPALPEPFVKFQLEEKLKKLNLLAKTTGAEGRALEDRWEVFRRKLRQLGEQGGDRRVANHVLEPLMERLGYSCLERQAEVITREGAEDGGWLFTTAEGQRLRAWTVSLGTDLDAPNRRGRAYRFSPSRVAQRVLLASGERMGLLSDGEELRILLCDPARPDSHISIRLDRAGGWRAARALPDSYRLLLALASPAGVAALPDLTEAARLAQSSVTKKLRLQARRAIEGFLQEVLEHPANAQALAVRSDRQQLAQQLWGEGLITVYRLLFVFKLEASDNPARAFSFKDTSLWRNTYSPNTALADLVRRVLDEGKESGGFLEAGLRTLWKLFAEGMSSSELEIKPLGGMLFGRDATPLLGQLQWGEQAVARLLDALLWTPGEGVTMRERVHYGALDVEDLGRVYESLLELEPGISSEPMCRLRRAKLEVVVPVAQGNTYRSNPVQASDPEESGEDEEEGDEDEPAPTRGRAASGSKTKVEFIEEIAADRFFLRVGLGRKASGSYYTPHPFVRFLVQETLGVLLAECSPRDNPQPLLILKLKVLDAAMGSGHFLVEACRFLGEGLYEACRLCDELAVQAEEQAEKTEGEERETLLAKAAELRKRVEDLPDPNNELLAYLPSRAAEGEESGLSQKKAEAMCRRLVAVHCLYGVDKNPLAVELAKLSLWLESYAEGLPLTFLDHRLICGDSLTGPFFEHLLTYPKSGGRLDDLFAQGLTQRLEDTLASALVHVRELEASVGKDLADLHQKESAKKKLDEALIPLKTLAAAWAGGVMLGDDCDDAGYKQLAEAVSLGTDLVHICSQHEGLSQMLSLGNTAIPYQLLFPEVFFRTDGSPGGFDCVLGNPPWDAIKSESSDFFGSIDVHYLCLSSRVQREDLENQLLKLSGVEQRLRRYLCYFHYSQRIHDQLFNFQRERVDGRSSSRQLDAFRLFTERSYQVLRDNGTASFVLPSGFHANSGAVSLRRLLMDHCRIIFLYVFTNKNKYFEIATHLKYDLLCFRKSTRTDSFQFGCGIEDTGFLFECHGRMQLFIDDLRRLSPDFLVIPEVASPKDLQIQLSASVYADCVFGDLARQEGPQFQREVNMDAGPSLIFTSPTQIRIVQGRDMDFYHAFLDDVSYYLNPLKVGAWANRLSFPRLSMKRVVTVAARGKIVCALLPASTSTSGYAEAHPDKRQTHKALSALARLNSFVCDYLIGSRVKATLNLFMLDSLPWSRQTCSFLAHSALRLSCNHQLYQPIWNEQLGDTWREAGQRFSWPVLDDEDDRWKLISSIDAVVAASYGLSRSQYEHILASFTHRAFPKCPQLCLNTFDELAEIGFDEFSRNHDPYWDIPLNENLPEPVSNLSVHSPDDAILGPLFNGYLGTDTPQVPVLTRPAPSTEVIMRLSISASSSTNNNDAFTTIAVLLRSRGVITSSDAQQATGLDAAGVRPYLQQLVQQGLAVTEGQRRGMRYRRVDG